MSEFEVKLARVREVLGEKNLSAVVIRRNPNLAWLISGRVHVPSSIDLACFDLVISATEVFAVTNAIEAPRLVAEEFPSGLQVKIVQWWESRDSHLPSGDTVGSDQPGADRIDISFEIEILRQQLSTYDAERLHSISQDAARALGDALKTISHTDREIDVAGVITRALWQRNLDIAFLGVAGEERVFKYRHPLPTESLIGSRVVASIFARRKGLIASVTRIVTFGPVVQTYEDEYRALLNVEAAMLDATVVGKTFSHPIQAAQFAYSAQHFDSDEWTKHHQGGPTGFLPRDWPATPQSSRIIYENQAIAWNPTARGWKVEDTFLATTDGPITLSLDEEWPMIHHQGRKRPDILRRG